MAFAPLWVVQNVSQTKPLPVGQKPICFTSFSYIKYILAFRYCWIRKAKANDLKWESGIIEKSVEPLVGQHGPLRKLGSVGTARKNWEGAVENYRRFLAIEETIFGKKHARVASAHFDLGSLCVDKEGRDEALECFQRSLESDRAEFGENHSRVAADYAYNICQSQIQINCIGSNERNELGPARDHITLAIAWSRHC
jgi:tetratricopeptide (TPR) repeat protein